MIEVEKEDEMARAMCLEFMCVSFKCKNVSFKLTVRYELHQRKCVAF